MIWLIGVGRSGFYRAGFRYQPSETEVLGFMSGVAGLRLFQTANWTVAADAEHALQKAVGEEREAAALLVFFARDQVPRVQPAVGGDARQAIGVEDPGDPCGIDGELVRCVKRSQRLERVLPAAAAALVETLEDPPLMDLTRSTPRRWYCATPSAAHRRA